MTSETKQFLVFHAPVIDSFLFSADDFPACSDISEWNLVASVQAKNLDGVYSKTQHISSDWTKNSGVKNNAPEIDKRSTSVGDVIYDCNAGTFNVVASFGFFEAQFNLESRAFARDVAKLGLPESEIA
jgi:hypothetical protein